MIARLTTHHSVVGKPIAKLRCHDRAQELGQPRVSALFQFASDHAKRNADVDVVANDKHVDGAEDHDDMNSEKALETFAGDIVVLSNADIAFDETLSKAPSLLTELTTSDVLVFSVTSFPDNVSYSTFVGNGNVYDTEDVAFKLSRKKDVFRPQVLSS